METRESGEERAHKEADERMDIKNRVRLIL